MFPAGLFPSPLFPPGLFPGAGKGLDISGDLLDAVETYLGQLLVPGHLTWVGAGMAGPNTLMPYAVIGDPEETANIQEDGTDHPPYDDEGELTITVVAASREACKALTATIGSKYPAGLSRAPLALADGQLLLLRRTTRGAPVLEDELAPAGEQAWIGHVAFSTIVSKVL